MPDIDPDEYTLEVESNSTIGIPADRSFTLAQLMNDFPKHEVVSALQCAGPAEDYVTDRPLYVAPHSVWCHRLRQMGWCACQGRPPLALTLMPFRYAKRERTAPKLSISLRRIQMRQALTRVAPIEKAIDPFGDDTAYEMNGGRFRAIMARQFASLLRACWVPPWWVRQIILSAAASELDSDLALTAITQTSVGTRTVTTRRTSDAPVRQTAANTARCAWKRVLSFRPGQSPASSVCRVPTRDSAWRVPRVCRGQGRGMVRRRARHLPR